MTIELHEQAGRPGRNVRLDTLVRLHTPWPPGLIGHPHQYDIPSNLAPESLSGPNAGLTEVLIPAGYVTTVYDPTDGKTPLYWWA